MEIAYAVESFTLPGGCYWLLYALAQKQQGAVCPIPQRDYPEDP